MDHKPSIFCFGLNHKSAPLQIREQFFMPKDSLLTSLPLVSKAYDFAELMILSTCNRVEMYGVTHTPCASIAQSAFSSLTNAPLAKGGDHFYHLQHEQAVSHLFEVTASLDSLVVGETQIANQVKNAFALSNEAQTLGPVLSRLSMDAVAASRRVRAHTQIGEKQLSISKVAIDLAKRVFSDITEQRFGFVGAGEMIKIALQYAIDLKPEHLFVFNRTLENGEQLLEGVANSSAFPLMDLKSRLHEIDILFTCTGAPHFILDKTQLSACLKKRKGRPLFIIDLAVPRNIDPEVSELSDVYLFELDDLETIVKENYTSRLASISEAKVILENSQNQAIQWLNQYHLRPTLAEFSTYLDTLLHKESQKTFGKELFVDLDQKQQQAIQQLLNSIKKKLVGDVAQVMQQPGSEDKQQLISNMKSLLTPKP